MRVGGVGVPLLLLWVDALAFGKTRCMPAPISTHQQFLFVTEVAAIARVSVGTVRHWIATGKLPSVKPGRRVLVRFAALQQFLDAAERVRKVERPDGR